MKTVLFIGNRSGVAREIVRFKELHLASVYAERDSFLHRDLSEFGCHTRLFTAADEDAVANEIARGCFDLLISNGCPFVLPIATLGHSGRLFLNVHPGLLPCGRGRHPINGVVLRGERFTGATLHYMDEGIDTGAIVHQEKREVTDDLDIGLLYRMTFDLETSTVRAGMQKLLDSNFAYRGEAQSGQGWYYSRKPEDQAVDFQTMSNADIVRRIRAFGIPSQGVTGKIGDEKIRIFDAEAVSNASLMARYASERSGTVVLSYEGRLLVRTREGLLKIKSFVAGAGRT